MPFVLFCSCYFIKRDYVGSRRENSSYWDDEPGSKVGPNNKEKVSRIIANNILEYLDKSTYPLEVQENKVDKPNGTIYYVQVGAFKNKENAIALQKKLIKDGYKAIIK